MTPPSPHGSSPLALWRAQAQTAADTGGVAKQARDGSGVDDRRRQTPIDTAVEPQTHQGPQRSFQEVTSVRCQERPTASRCEVSGERAGGSLVPYHVSARGSARTRAGPVQNEPRLMSDSDGPCWCMSRDEFGWPFESQQPSVCGSSTHSHISHQTADSHPLASVHCRVSCARACLALGWVSLSLVCAAAQRGRLGGVSKKPFFIQYGQCYHLTSTCVAKHISHDK